MSTDYIIQENNAMASTAKHEAINFSELLTNINELTEVVADKIDAFRSQDGEKKEMSIAEMFDLQLAMNKLSQLTEMSTGVVSGMNMAIASMSRNLKG